MKEWNEKKERKKLEFTNRKNEHSVNRISHGIDGQLQTDEREEGYQQRERKEGDHPRKKGIKEQRKELMKFKE